MGAFARSWQKQRQERNSESPRGFEDGSNWTTQLARLPRHERYKSEGRLSLMRRSSRELQMRIGREESKGWRRLQMSIWMERIILRQRASWLIFLMRISRATKLRCYSRRCEIKPLMKLRG